MPAILEFHLTGGVDNTDPNASLGGVMSTTELSETPLNSLFDDIEPNEARDGDTEYRALDIFNSGDEDAVDISLWLPSVTVSPDTTISIGLDTTTDAVVDENTAPVDVVFVAPTLLDPLVIPDIAADSAQRIWFKRVCDELALNNKGDGFPMILRYA